MSVKNGFFALLFILFSLPTWAIETCHLEGKIVLDRDTTFECHDIKDQKAIDLVIAAGTHIVTNGYALTFRSDASIVDQGMKIDSFEGEVANALNGKDAGPIQFFAESLSGACQYIHNTGYKNGAGGGIRYQLMTFDGDGGPYKCHDMTTAGVGQGWDGGVFASANYGEIPYSEFKAQVID